MGATKKIGPSLNERLKQSLGTVKERELGPQPPALIDHFSKVKGVAILELGPIGHARGFGHRTDSHHGHRNPRNLEKIFGKAAEHQPG